jgi:uncharacterized protein (DUF885 family)
VVLDHANASLPPKARGSIACIELPQGRDWYAFALRNQTTTDLAPQAIHDIGLSEVKRIRDEMLQVIRRTDWFAADPARATMPDDDLFAAFVKYLRTDPRFYFTKADELMAGYRDMAKRIDAHLPALFGRLPQLPYGVREIPRFMAPSQTTAYYQSGNMKAGNPGWFYANTYALDQRPKYEMVPLTLHEAVPGHHLQIALAEEATGVPRFRRSADVTAFTEGWGLYAEKLGGEMGIYRDPWERFGRLSYEMWRACRLVADTGIHWKGWALDTARACFTDNSALSPLNIEVELARYVSWPGQALAYKTGEMRIVALREAARQRLGERFDIRRFHDAVLLAGPLPLDMLETRIKAWTEAEAARRP